MHTKTIVVAKQSCSPRYSKDSFFFFKVAIGSVLNCDMTCSNRRRSEKLDTIRGSSTCTTITDDGFSTWPRRPTMYFANAHASALQCRQPHTLKQRKFLGTILAGRLYRRKAVYERWAQRGIPASAPPWFLHCTRSISRHGYRPPAPPAFLQLGISLTDRAASRLCMSVE